MGENMTGKLAPLRFKLIKSTAPVEDFLMNGLEDIENVQSDKRYFIRLIGVKKDEIQYVKEIAYIDNYFLNKHREVPYLRLDQLAYDTRDSSLDELITIYDQFTMSNGVDDSSEVVFPIQFKECSLEHTQRYAFKKVLQIMRQTVPGQTDSMVRNFGVKLLYWIKTYGKRLLKDDLNVIPKLVYTGDIKRHELYFLYYMSLMGCDVLYMNPKEDLIKKYPECIRFSSLVENPKKITQGEIKVPQYYPSKELLSSSKEIPSTQEEFQVAIIATMSAGKSTFMNTLTHSDLFPSQNQACTAKITSYKYNKDNKYLMGYALTDDNEYLHCDKVQKENINEWNQSGHIQKVHIEGYIPWVNPQNKKVLVLNDTPGTNFSQDASHQKMTLDFLKENTMDVILYVINATQIATEDDQFLMKAVRHFVEGRKTKVIFVVNKMDMFDVEADDDIQTSLEGLKDYIRNNGFETFELIPISGQAAFIFKKVQKGEDLSRQEERMLQDFAEIFEEEVYHLSQYSSIKLPMPKANNKLEELLNRTNVPIIEALLNKAMG